MGERTEEIISEKRKGVPIGRQDSTMLNRNDRDCHFSNSSSENDATVPTLILASNLSKTPRGDRNSVS